jgi:hypothetical protein
MQIDDNFFAVVVEQTGIIRSGSAISGGGRAEVFGKGRLVRRFQAVEDANSSWGSMNSCGCPTVNREAIARRAIQSTSNVSRPDALVDVVSADFTLPSRLRRKSDGR